MICTLPLLTAILKLLESLLTFNKGHLPPSYIVSHMLTINMQSVCLSISYQTNHSYMHNYSSFFKGWGKTGPVYVPTTPSVDSLNGSRLLPWNCRGYKWSPNGFMAMKTKPKHMAPWISWTLQTDSGVSCKKLHFPASSAKHLMMSWLVEGLCCVLPTELQTHIEGVLASFDRTTPYKDM